MSFLKSIWSDSLMVSSQFEKDHPNLDRIFGWETFYDWQMYEFFLSQSCSNILCHLLIIFTSFHLDCLGFINSFLASGDFCCLLIVFANSLDPGQYRQNIGPELDTDRLPSSESVSVRVFEKVNFGKKSADDIKVLK